jgi:hypothetical protein
MVLYSLQYPESMSRVGCGMWDVEDAGARIILS